jgi:hypothetical protein
LVKFLAENGADLRQRQNTARSREGVGLPGVRQAAREPFAETVALLESLMAAKGIPLSSAK